MNHDREREDVAFLVDAMSRAAFYPERPRQVELRQTHISYVFLTDDMVFKVKKPVRFSFLDYSTLDKRLHYCREEVRLNRRLAPHVYRGVVPIWRSDGEFALGDGGGTLRRGEIVEYAVQMQRLDDERSLDRLVLNGKAAGADIRSIARRVARFHASAPSARAARFGGRRTIWRRIQDNFKETRPFESVTHSRRDRQLLRRYSRDFFASHEALLAARVAAGRVREGHGDLRAEHVYLGSDGTISIVDCVEFSESLRTCDGVSEIAFLAMDLDFLGADHLSRELVAAYAGETRDAEVGELYPFYATYRALVRGKVEGLKSAEPEIPEEERRAATARAQRYFDLALRYAGGCRPPAVLIVCGKVGTGKSSLTRRLRDRTGFPAFNSDVVRKELAGLEPARRVRQTFTGGIYSPAFTDKTYAALGARAEETLNAERGVIIDATFSLPAHRARFQSLAARRKVPLLFIECTVPEAEIHRRLEARAQQPGEVSDADWQVYERLRQTFTPLREIADSCHLLVRTDRSIDPALQRIDEFLREP